MEQSIIRQIKESTNIIDIVSEHINLIKKGRNYWALCPFHEDSNPSMSISEEKQIYKCFVCQAGGNVINFLSDYQKISFLEATKFLAKRAGIKTGINEITRSIYSKDEEDMLEVMKQAMYFFQYSLDTPSGKKAKEYLIKRDITQKEIEKFNIGYAPAKGLINFLEKKQFKDEDIINVSLANDNLRPFYHDRIIFGIKNNHGNIVAYSGRSLEENPSSKYINSRENKMFNKSQILYNFHNAANAIRKTREIYITEGFMDVIALVKVGVENVVAIMGTALTQYHVNIFKGYKVNLFLDPDKAGITSTIKSLEILQKNNIDVYVITNETMLDPDEILSKFGKEKLLQISQNKMSSFQYIYEFLSKIYDHNDPKKVEKFINEFVKMLDKAPLTIRDFYINKISKEWNISKNIITSMLQPQKTYTKPLKVTKNNTKSTIWRKDSYWLLNSIKRKLDFADLLKANTVNFPEFILILIGQYYIDQNDGINSILTTNMKQIISEIEMYEDIKPAVKTRKEVLDIIKRINEKESINLNNSKIKVQLNNPSVTEKTKVELLENAIKQRQSRKKD